MPPVLLLHLWYCGQFQGANCLEGHKSQLSIVAVRIGYKRTLYFKFFPHPAGGSGAGGGGEKLLFFKINILVAAAPAAVNAVSVRHNQPGLSVSVKLHGQ